MHQPSVDLTNQWYRAVSAVIEKSDNHANFNPSWDSEFFVALCAVWIFIRKTGRHWRSVCVGWGVGGYTPPFTMPWVIIYIYNYIILQSRSQGLDGQDPGNEVVNWLQSQYRNLIPNMEVMIE
jgi:hypothetical protein